MSNRAYLSIWCKDFAEPVMLERFQSLLETVPYSATRTGFSALVVRALSPDEGPLLERDFRIAAADAAAVVDLARGCTQADCSCETHAYWDLWTYDLLRDRWQLGPEKIEVLCLGEQYDNEAWREVGHFWIYTGFEHVFTGHAGLIDAAPIEAAERHPTESEFILRMQRPGHLAAYRRRTQENIHKLKDWVQRIHGALPVSRWQVWSEGEADLGSRLESILAAK